MIFIQNTSQMGKVKKSVILPIAEFEALIEDMEDLAAVSHEGVVAELKTDGLLSDRMEAIGQKGVKQACKNSNS